MERRQSARLCQACSNPQSHKLKHVCGKGRGKRSMDDVVEPAARRQRSGDQSCEVVPMLPELLGSTSDKFALLNKSDYVIGKEVFVDGSNSHCDGGHGKIVSLKPRAGTAQNRVQVKFCATAKSAWVSHGSLLLWDSDTNGPMLRSKRRAASRDPCDTPHAKRARGGASTAVKRDSLTGDKMDGVNAASVPDTEIKRDSSDSSSCTTRRFDENKIEIELQVWACGEVTFRLHIKGSHLAVRHNQNLARTKEMLAACLTVVVPRLQKIADAMSLPNIHVWAISLRWARAEFKNVFRSCGDFRSIGVSAAKRMTAANISEWYREETLHTWSLICTSCMSQVANTNQPHLQQLYSVTDENISSEAIQRRREDDYRAKKNIRRAAMRKHNQAILRVWSSTQCIVSANVNYASRGAYQRDRLTNRHHVAGKARRVLFRGGCSDVSVPVRMTARKQKTAEDKLIRDYGVQPDTPILDPTEHGKDDTPEIGVAHDAPSFYALIIRAMIADGKCKVDIRNSSATKDKDGCVGRFEHTFVSFWSDSAPVAAHSASATAIRICDPACELSVDGTTYPIQHSLWKGKEELFVLFMEACCAQAAAANSDYVRVDFPEHGTHILLLLPWKLVAGDHKFLCEIMGNLGAGAHRRLHFLECLPIHLADDVYLYKTATLMNKLEWRMITLQMVCYEMLAVLNNPEKMVRTEAKMKAWLLENHPQIPRPGKGPELLARIRPLWPQYTLADLPKALQVGGAFESAGINLETIYKACRTRTGVSKFPVFSGNNPRALEHMLQFAADLEQEKPVAGEGEVNTRTSEHLKLLLDLDARFEDQVWSFWRRSPDAQAWLVDLLQSRRIVSGPTTQSGELPHAGVDLKQMRVHVAQDHDGKAIGKWFVDAVILHNQKLKLKPELIKALTKSMLAAMGTVGFKNFVYGWHYNKLFHHCRETFASTPPSILALALLIARSNRLKRQMRRPLGDTTRPDHECSVERHADGSFSVTPVKSYATDCTSLVTGFAVSFALPTMLRILSGMSTLSTYIASERWRPFLQAEMVKQNQTSTDASDFDFEQVHKHTKRFCENRGGKFGMRTIEQCSKQLQLKYIARGEVGSGGSDHNNQLRDENEPGEAVSDTVIVRPCILDHDTGETRDTKHGNYSDVVQDNQEYEIVEGDGDELGGLTAATQTSTVQSSSGSEQYDNIEWADLQAHMYVEIQLDETGEWLWYPAFIRVVSESELVAYYPESLVNPGGPTDQTIERSALETGIKFRVPVDGEVRLAPWVVEFDDPDCPEPSAAAPTGTLYEQRMAATAKVGNAYGNTALATPFPAQTKRNLHTYSTAAAKHGKQYLTKVNNSTVLGIGAVTQTLHSEVKAHAGDTPTVLESIGSKWSSNLPTGLYALIVEPEALLIEVTDSGAGSRLAHAWVMPVGTVKAMVSEVTTAAWADFVGPQDVEDATLQAKTNGARPIDVCVCDQFACSRCSHSKLFSGVDTERMPAAFRLGESADQQLAKNAKWAWQDRKRAWKIVHRCLEQEYQACMEALPAASVKLKPDQQKQLEGAVSSETVLPILRRNCGEDWLKNAGFGGDEPEASKRMEGVIRGWLKHQLGVDPKSTRKKKGLAVDLHKQWDRGVPRVFQSQQVMARWTDGRGNVSTAPWNGHYRAQVVGDAISGQYRLLFAPHDGHPAQEHPCVPIEHIDHRDPRIWDE
jgi:hypothetical protein